MLKITFAGTPAEIIQLAVFGLCLVVIAVLMIVKPALATTMVTLGLKLLR